MQKNRLDTFARALAHRRSRRHTIALLASFFGAPLIAAKSANAQDERECPDGWRDCFGTCIPFHRCCTADDCAPGQDCWHGICLGEETECDDSDDCPAFHVCSGGSCIPF
jgi:hypothetical protein